MNGRSLALGQYYPARSALHTLDPRVKLLLMLALVTAIFFINNLAVMVAAGLLVPVLATVAKVPYSWVIRGLRPLLFILILTFFIHVFFTPGARLAAIGPLTATRAGLRNGAFYSLRLGLVVLFSSFVTLTTTPVQLTDAIESIFGPLKKFRLPVHEVALMMTIALRFIPTLLSEAETIMQAQKARGADFESGHIFKRAKSFVPLLIPLFISAFRRADELALAMEARGYAGGEGRTRLHVLKVRAADVVWLIGGLAVIALVVGVRWAV
ncbi:MAG: energy-coupling factor transporter transmembrane component T [Actinomycetota bacterium]|nr:energy-coupling factor transporter transmembrane component T [Actinomycetota bacterium]